MCLLVRACMRVCLCVHVRVHACVCAITLASLVGLGRLFIHQSMCLVFQTSSLDGLIPEMTHVLQYKDGVDDFSVFDISACYDQMKQTKTVVFSLPGMPMASLGNIFPTSRYMKYNNHSLTARSYLQAKRGYYNLLLLYEDI